MGFDSAFNGEKITGPNIVSHLFHIGLKNVKIFNGPKIILNLTGLKIMSFLIGLYLKWAATSDAAEVEDAATSTLLRWQTLPPQLGLASVTITNRHRIGRSMTILKKRHPIQSMT